MSTYTVNLTTKAEQEMRERFAKRLSDYGQKEATVLLRIETPEELALLRPLCQPREQNIIDQLLNK